MKEEVIEKMSQVAKDLIVSKYETGEYSATGTGELIAESLLNLHYPCKLCKGKKEVWMKGAKFEDACMRGLKQKETCPLCKGTGEGGKMFAILDEKQEVPECNTPLGIYDDGWHQRGFNDAVELLLSQGWKKAV